MSTNLIPVIAPIVEPNYTHIAAFPSMQKRRWIFTRDPRHRDVIGSRIFTFISPATERLEIRQVPAEKQVLPIEYKRLWSWTAEGRLCCKRCKSKSGFFFCCKFRHCGYFTHVVWQPFGAIPSSSDMFSRICSPSALVSSALVSSS